MRKPSIYWDSNIFIAWMMGENDFPNKLDNIKGLFELARRGYFNIVTSSAIFAEVLSGKCSEEVYGLFQQQFKKRYCKAYDASQHFFRLAGDMRSDDPRIRMADALHLATSSILGAVEFHTYDGVSKFGLLQLSKEFQNKYGLKIIMPTDTMYAHDVASALKPQHEQMPIEYKNGESEEKH